MGTKDRLILDIRYYESGTTLPRNLGNEYVFSIDTESVGARIARKLREYGLVLGKYDHLYITFTNKLPEEKIAAWTRSIDPRIHCVDYGISSNTIGQMSAEEQVQFLYAVTFSVLEHLIKEEKAQVSLINQAKNEILRHNANLEILHKQKDTSSYSVTITYQIKPNGGKSLGWILYKDKKGQWSKKIQFIELEHYQDIFFLVASISIVKGVIRLSPRESFRAEIWNRRYDEPIEISLERLKNA